MKNFSLALKIKAYNSTRKNICINLSDDRSIIEKEKDLYINNQTRSIYLLTHCVSESQTDTI